MDLVKKKSKDNGSCLVEMSEDMESGMWIESKMGFGKELREIRSFASF